MLEETNNRPVQLSETDIKRDNKNCRREERRREENKIGNGSSRRERERPKLVVPWKKQRLRKRDKQKTNQNKQIKNKSFTK